MVWCLKTDNGTTKEDGFGCLAINKIKRVDGFVV